MLRAPIEETTQTQTPPAIDPDRLRGFVAGRVIGPDDDGFDAARATVTRSLAPT